MDVTVGTVYFLGAGSSYGTLQPWCRVFPPLACQFGRQLEQRVKDWEVRYTELAKVVTHLGRPISEIGLEEIWTCIDYHAKFQGAFAIAWEPRGRVVAELKASLLGLYGQACDEQAEKLPLSDDYTLGEIVRRMESGDTLVSFNYDTIVERLFKKREGDLKLRHCSGLPPSGVVRFAKPHGSASWNLRSLGHDITDGEPALKSLNQTDVLNDPNRVDPLLLGAVPIKSELIAEVQCYFGTHRIHDVVLAHWRAVADAVRDAERVIVLGYSFPREDAYGRFFLREAVRERSKRLLRFDIYDLPTKEAEIKCSICEAFGGNVTLELKYVNEVRPAHPSA
jgi:hypothetical protein